MNKIYFAKTKENAIIPTKLREDAGYDFYACFEEDFIEIKPHETKLIPTGIAWASSPEFYLQIEERSSTGSKGIKKSAGVIDSGYRGEILVAISNVNDKTLIISKLSEEELSTSYPQVIHRDIHKSYILYPYTKAIAQGIVHRVLDLEVEEMPYDKLKQIESKRGIGAFGSSNK